MAGDGISLQTNLAQLGNVARSQAKGQQAQQNVTPFAEQTDRKDELRIQRVKETEQASKGRIDPDADRRRERRRRRRERLAENRRLAAERGENAETETEADVEIQLGRLVDTRV
jgi:hypothetical protein